VKASVGISFVNFIAGGIGNGRATAILLARQGAKVALLDQNVDAAQETKRMIDEEGGISEVIQCDVTVEAACENAVKKTIELFGAVHILVNVGTPIMKHGIAFFR
jgi:NAD(P)-dependent dehydrogenase (short-subunit alcohol dehydrogenase family)